jgi:DNA excision repair protein ERCC-3
MTHSPLLLSTCTLFIAFLHCHLYSYYLSPPVYLIIMSDAESPASSLDFISSDDSDSGGEYAPATHKRALNKRRPATTTNAAAGSSTSGARKALKIKINLGSSARSGAALHPVEGDVEMDDEIEEQVAGVMGSRVMDLSNRELKKDHSARPLWVDEAGHMYVLLITA